VSVTITLGKSDRLVVPKAIRNSLGLQEGSRLRLEVQGGKIEASPESDEVPIIMDKRVSRFQRWTKAQRPAGCGHHQDG
jgi:AbrB family looped-hinge helix DNA binding protein